jgi:peptide-methionine (R)-S-oxide reductase
METIDMNRPTDPRDPPNAPNAPNAHNPIDGPRDTYPVHKSDEAWRSELSGLEYEVTRHAATERPFTGRYWDHWDRGVYDCVCCGTPLFESSTKFDAGCGWPSYFKPLDGEVIEERTDRSHGMLRIEVRCKKCGAHLGHVFEDGPAPTGLRYCINSAALQFEPK